MSIEFHCHTLFSIDGSGTPEALVDIVKARGVTTLSITEHNSLGSAGRAAARAAEHGIRYLTGVEIDAFFQDNSYHFLGFGVDPEHPGLQAVIRRNHDCYRMQFDLIFQALRELGFPWEREALEAFLPQHYPTHPEPVLNRYVLGRFLRAMGREEQYAPLVKEAQQSVAGIQRYSNPGPDEPGRFCRFAQARDAIHDAGGVCLLAHVGQPLPDLYEAQAELIRAVMDAGADGFELYHPKNDRWADRSRLERLASETGAVISCGSDCHHAPDQPERIGAWGADVAIADALFKAVQRRRTGAAQRAG